MGISLKQKQILAFPYTHYDALIADGAIRSGKTAFMTIAFIDWAMREYNNQRFGICGKTIGSAEKNVIVPYISLAYAKQRYKLQWRRGDKELIVSTKTKRNVFEVFGGKDESSFTLIQGRTLAGVMLDEVALQPRSFVEQAIARCSVEGSKLFFNCNPDSPRHWFRQEWILQLRQKNALHLHFTMDDNPSLTDAIKARYRAMYSGVFYQRFVQGLWIAAEGRIYDMFSDTENTYRPEEKPVDMEWVSNRTIAIDYGTTNPTRFLDIYDNGETIRIDREYSWDSRKEYRQKTDKEYADDFEAFLGESTCAVIVDPSAASFIAELKGRGYYIIPADNEVNDGIRKTATLIKKRVIQVNTDCVCILDEFASYMWDDKATLRGEDKPLKTSDHSLDALRYYINSLPDWRFE